LKGINKMRILLDTHILLWSAVNRLPDNAVKYVLDENNTLYFSSANIWEVVIKNGLNKADFFIDPHMLYSGLLNNGYEELAVTSQHALVVSSLPGIHKDPFDRILLAQALSESIPLLTADSRLSDYPAPIILV